MPSDIRQDMLKFLDDHPFSWFSTLNMAQALDADVPTTLGNLHRLQHEMYTPPPFQSQLHHAMPAVIFRPQPPDWTALLWHDSRSMTEQDWVLAAHDCTAAALATADVPQKRHFYALASDAVGRARSMFEGI